MSFSSSSTEFQSQNGLILVTVKREVMEEVYNISIPKWSDFSLEFQDKLKLVELDFNPKMV